MTTLVLIFVYFSPAATAMNAAAVDDVIAWCILAVVLAIVRASAPLSALYTILSTAAVVLFMALVLRPALDWLLKRLRRGNEGDEVSTAVLVVIVGASCVCSRPFRKPMSCTHHSFL